MNKVDITKSFFGLCGMQVCAEKGTTDEEILEVCNKENPSGTSNGWCEVIRNKVKDNMLENCKSVECDDDSNREHLLVIC